MIHCALPDDAAAADLCGDLACCMLSHSTENVSNTTFNVLIHGSESAGDTDPCCALQLLPLNPSYGPGCNWCMHPIMPWPGPHGSVIFAHGAHEEQKPRMHPGVLCCWDARELWRQLQGVCEHHEHMLAGQPTTTQAGNYLLSAMQGRNMSSVQRLPRRYLAPDAQPRQRWTMPQNVCGLVANLFRK